jgi:hypothetical protein
MRFGWLLTTMLLAPPILGQTGGWTVSVRPSSFADPAACTAPQLVRDMSGSGALACVTPEYATTALTASSLTADPPPCAAGEFARDIAANGTLTCGTPPSGGVSDHGALTGLADDDHAQYLVTAGRSGGQVITGATNTGGQLILRPNSVDNTSSVFIQRGPDGSPIAEFRNGLVQVWRDMYPGVDGNAWVRFGVTPSATTPVVLPSSLDPDTGIGRAGNDQLSAIAGGVEVGRFSGPTPGLLTLNNVLRLTPAAAPPATCDATTAGAIYYRTGGTFCGCNATAWAAFLGPGPCSP